MHRDIRSFFTVKKAKKKVDDEDIDIIPESPEVKLLNNKKKQSRKRRQIQEDSDEEIFTPPRKKQNEPKSALKEVKVVDLFGSGPIKRSEPLVKKSKKETETGIHSDDEFEKSLLQLDEVDNLVSSSSPFKDNHVARIDSIGKPNDGTIKNHDSKEKYDEGNEKFKNSSNYERYVKKFEIQDGINKKSKKPFQKKEADKVDKDQTISDSKSEPKKHVSKDTFNLKDKESSHKRKLDKVNSDQTTGDSKLEPEKYVSNDTVHMKDKESSLKRKLEKFDRDQKIGDSESKNHDSNDSVHIKVKESSHKRKLEKVYSDQTIVDKKVGPKNHENISKKDKVSSNERKLDKLDNDLQRNDKKSKHENHDSKNYAHTKNDNESTCQKRKLDNINDDVTNIDTKPDKIKKEKQDFNEFLKDDKITIHDDKNGEPKQKKVKLDKSLNDSALTDEERHERKRYSAALYQKFLNRSGPKHLGSKEIPEGLPNCLRDCAFLLTGVLDSFERDEVVAAITKYGGCVKSGISKKVTHVIAGDDAGPAKLAKAEELGIKIINEDEFLKMIKDSNDKHKHSNHKDKNVDRKRDKSKEKKTNNHGESNKKETKTEGIKIKDSKSSLTNGTSKKERSVSPKPVVCKDEVKSGIKTPTVNGDTNKSGDLTETASLMWVDKYKPTSVKQIIGQHGDKSNVKKLTNWLTNWYVNRKAKIPKPSPWAKDDNGAYYKAALLSGPPGVGPLTSEAGLEPRARECLGKKGINAGGHPVKFGKTTTVSLVCKELGFDMVEFNASDTRSKTLIREQIGELLTTTSLSAYAKGATGKGAVSKKHVLVMDEVDGMAGNEDRGGLQELISLIKSTSVPVICMCNDRSSEKMRSLVNYCYDLRFERPRVNQIMCAMLSVCFKEGVKVPNDVLTQLIEAAGHDVRQTLHMLSVWVADSTLMDHDRLKQEAGRAKKDMKMGPWEAIRRVFSAEEHRSMSIGDKSDLFFTDYSIMPLFVQENYLSVVPHGPGKSSLSKLETLERVSRAADSISAGDLVDARIRRHQAWSLLPMQAMYSSVIPGQEMEGHVAGQIQFPGWLGKNSRATKMRRMAQEIHAHTRLSTSGSKSSIFLDYATHLRDAILNPLLQDKTDGIDQSLRVLESYNLLREDLDSLVELSMWPEKRNPMVLIDAKVKAALTRTYNKTASALPYAPGAVKKGRGLADDDDENTQDDAGEAEDDSDPEHDAMIKKKKSKETEKAGPSKAAGKGKKTAPPSEPPSKGKKKTTNIKR